MKKRLIALTLCLLICMMSFSGCGNGTAAAGDEYTVGKQIDGYTVSEVSTIDSLNAKTVLFTHNATGARIIFILNDDSNMGFSICFHTEPTDNSGMLHILEHAVCASSAQYPGNDVFFDASSRAYITDMNAQTSLSSTNYYVTSTDENQLSALADYYLDCAYESAVGVNEQYFNREGWRYEMADANAPLTINGVVYNEMSGAMNNIGRYSNACVASTLFPDSYQGRNSGGNSSEIPNLSYEQLVNFYHECYSPSNSLTMFYGNVNVERFLKQMDANYYSKAENKEKSPISAGQKAFEAPKEATFSFPVAANSESNGSVITYSTVLTDEASSKYVEYAAWDGITSMFSNESSPLMIALNDSKIGSQYGAYIDQKGTQFVITFYAMDADKSRSEDFKNIIFEQLNALCDNGPDMDVLRAVFDSRLLSFRLARNQSNVATSEFDSLMWIQETGDTTCLDKEKVYREAKEKCTADFVGKEIKEWILNNPHALLATVIPEPGLLEKNQQELKTALAAKKSAMSTEEIQKIVDDTAAFVSWNESSTTPESTVQKFAVVDASTVNVAIPERKTTDETTENGIRVMTAEAGTDMTQARVILDISDLTAEQMQKLAMLSVLSNCSTATHTQQEITCLSGGLINALSINVRTLNKGNGNGTPTLELSWYMPREKAKESAALAFEMLKTTDITGNLDLLANYLSSWATSYSNPEWVLSNVMYNATLANTSQISNIYNQVFGMPLLDAIVQATQDYKNAPQEFASSLEDVRSKALTRSGAIVMLSGDPDGAARSAILSELDKLPLKSDAAAKSSEWEGTSDLRSIAFAGNAQSEYGLRGLNVNSIGEKIDGAKELMCTVVQDKFLLTQLRLVGGAYGASCSCNMNGTFSMSYYRGGDALGADKTFLSVPDELSALDITQSELDAYKPGVLAALSKPQGELSIGMKTLDGIVSGDTMDKLRTTVEEVRNAKVEDIKNLAPFLRKALDASASTVLTTAQNAKNNASQFDKIIQLP